MDDKSFIIIMGVISLLMMIIFAVCLLVILKRTAVGQQKAQEKLKTKRKHFIGQKREIDQEDAFIKNNGKMVISLTITDLISQRELTTQIFTDPDEWKLSSVKTESNRMSETFTEAFPETDNQNLPDNEI